MESSSGALSCPQKLCLHITCSLLSLEVCDNSRETSFDRTCAGQALHAIDTMAD